MEQYLAHFSGLDWLFLGSAVLGGTLFFGRMIMSFMGIGGDHHDLGHHDVSGGPAYTTGEHGETHSMDQSYLDFKFLSLQGLTAFGMMFGVIGLAVHTEMHMPDFIALLAGGMAGTSMVWIAKRLFRFASKFQSSGTIHLDSAIGNEGTVYLTLPPGDTGKVQLLVQNRLKVLDARTEDPAETIKTGEKVRVVHVEKNVLVVEKIPELPEEIGLENIS